MQQPLPSTMEDRLTILPDYMEREDGNNVFANREQYNKCKTNQIGISECKTFLRLKFILSNYMAWCLDDEPKTVNNGMYAIINEQLNGNKYDTIALLNDYHHILFSHHDQMEDVYNYLQINCKLHFCSAMRRNYRDRHCAQNNRSKIYFNFESAKEVNVIQILDQIHCHFLHSFEIGFDIPNVDLPPPKCTNANFDADGYIGFGELHEELSTSGIKQMLDENADYMAHNDELMQNIKQIVYEKSKTLDDLKIYQSQYNITGFDQRCACLKCFS